MFSFLLSEGAVDPEHVQHTHTQTDEEAHDKFCFRHSHNKCNVVLSIIVGHQVKGVKLRTLLISFRDLTVTTIFNAFSECLIFTSDLNDLNTLLNHKNSIDSL